MTGRRPALLLLAMQLVLVLSVAGKYLYERKVCPRVWTRTMQGDPDMPLRGRYLAMQLLVDGCALPHDQAHHTAGYRIYNGAVGVGSWHWRVALIAAGGKLVPTLPDHSTSRADTYEITQSENQTCDRVSLPSSVQYFIPDRVQTPFPLKRGEQLWVEVTLPPSGPPRPIQLALSGASGFRPLRFE